MMNDVLSSPFYFRLRGGCFALLALSGLLAMPLHAANNDVDEEGRLIAAPDETDLVERGYLFYPQRVLPKPPKDKVATAPTHADRPVNESDKAKPSHAQVAEAVAVNTQTPPSAADTHVVAANDGHANDSQHSDGHGATTNPLPLANPDVKSREIQPHRPPKPLAGNVIVQPLEPVKPPTPSAAAASHSDAHAATEPEKPLSKAEQAKAERAKAEQARAEKLKEMQAKAELAKQERAKAAAARAEKAKEEQAKAELARAERAKAVAQIRAAKAQDDLAKATKRLEELMAGKPAEQEEKAAASDKEKEAHPPAAPANASATKAESADKAGDTKAASGKAAEGKETPEKDSHAADAHDSGAKHSDAHHGADKQSSDAHASDAHAQAAPAATKPASSHADVPAAPAVAPARQKLLLTNDKRVSSAKD